MPLQAQVKSVLSGDTLVLCSVGNPAQERTLSLAFVSAPRIRREGDEPFAFESRDFLRRLVVGKVVQFQVYYKIPTGVNREYGTVILQNREQLPDLLVAEGWAKLRDDAGRKDESEAGSQLLEKLQALEARAKADEKGVWGTKGGNVETSYEMLDAKAFLEEWKGKSIDAIVEKVLSGDRLIVRLMPTPTRHVQTMLLIAGIRAPSTKRTNPDGAEQAAEAFGPEAHQFVDSRLMQRTVAVTILGISPGGQLVGSVKHPMGSIAEFVLKAGLARCTDHHSTMLGSEMGTLRQAEKHAKDNKLGLFRGHVAQRTTGGEVEVTVSRVWSGDTFTLRNRTGNEKRVNLSSVRQPKPSDPKQSPFGEEAKEFMRKRFIGKHVKVTTDGKRPPSDGFPEREMVTLKQGNNNAALMLIENGYGSVIRHRMDDPDRSPIYDELLAAEEAAQKDGKGMWAAKTPAAKAYVDHSESLEKAKRQMTLLSRQKKVPAVVDFVKSGSRFTILIPRENAKLTFVLGGIRAPRSARNENEKSEPFGQEAHDYANRRCLQRDVEIDVEDNDKVGGFIGTLYINRENFAKLLLEEGLASVHAYSAEKSGNANELFAAEQRAKDARKGMWHDYDPAQDAEDGADNVDESHATNGTSNGDSSVSIQPRKVDYRDVVITHVDGETGHLKLQQIGTGTSALQSLMDSFRKFHLNKANAQPLPGAPKAGDVVAAQFSADGEWYRARIRRNDRDNKQADVLYIDYGNSETLKWDRLRPLTQSEFSTARVKPQAIDAVLSLVQLPGNQDYVRDFVEFVMEAAQGGAKQLIANVDAQDPGTGQLSVTLLESVEAAGKGESVNREVVREGLGMVPKKLKAWERGLTKELEGLRAAQKEAMEGRRGMWEYGDLTED
ncbi:nuclease domain-containing protein 1 [Viridothelium virens]|uniref:Probable endonuclease LCL3 n=1 Tax=Viridothelium virens TaxID=1048519 RepID=A0A6A6H1C7_VIRVR|nr:nuclease domain-containing protein 1 [Viridothelium virens]